tara:strand:+ start:28 stop:702 length:675 start_codon:yes stop_codon:yes gene_type:complete
MQFYIYKLLENLNNEIITFPLLALLSFALGFSVRQCLIFSGQNWARSYNNTLTYLLLPLIGYVITQVISNSIALSLGMIGALSIIRFRHPVKSPFELTIYFLLLTLGITITSSAYKSIVLCIISNLIIYFFSYFRTKKYKRNSNLKDFSPFDLPTNEASIFLDVNSTCDLDLLSKNKNLIFSFVNPNQKNFSYKLRLENINDANLLKSNLMRNKNIIDISISSE